MLKKATIKPEGGSSFDVLFNPTDYSLSKGNHIAEFAVPGLEAPILQFTHGNARVLSMDLFFDTYEEEQPTDVRQYTDKVYALLALNRDTHAPPRCEITWGGFNFNGVVTDVKGKFTMFLPDGTPVRATLGVEFKEYIDVKVLVRQRPTRSADHRAMVQVKRGDSLPLLAERFYGDAKQWRPIAEANGIDDPAVLTPGTSLIIPKLA